MCEDDLAAQLEVERAEYAIAERTIEKLRAAAADNEILDQTIERLVKENDDLQTRLKNVCEVYRGSVGFTPTTEGEAYLAWVVEHMYDAAKTGGVG